MYYSNKTQAIDWAHGQKVGSVVDWLVSLGFVQAYLGPLGK